VDRNFTPPHVSVWDKSTRPDGTFSRADFVFDQERNIYVCPGGAELTSTGKIDQGNIVYYGAQQSRRERKKIEMRFAHMKRTLRLDRFRMRGMSGVRDEVLLTATAQNLRRLAKLLCHARYLWELLASHRYPRIGTAADTRENANKEAGPNRESSAFETSQVLQHGVISSLYLFVSTCSGDPHLPELFSRKNPASNVCRIFL
jgi:hypothetical protein